MKDNEELKNEISKTKLELKLKGFEMNYVQKEFNQKLSEKDAIITKQKNIINDLIQQKRCWKTNNNSSLTMYNVANLQ